MTTSVPEFDWILPSLCLFEGTKNFMAGSTRHDVAAMTAYTLPSQGSPCTNPSLGNSNHKSSFLQLFETYLDSDGPLSASSPHVSSIVTRGNSAMHIYRRCISELSPRSQLLFSSQVASIDIYIPIYTNLGASHTNNFAHVAKNAQLQVRRLQYPPPTLP